MESALFRPFQRKTPVWLWLVIIALAIFNGLPFLAPVLMKLGLDWAANIVYMVYSPLCHQMAQRSFFMFGPHGFEMYNVNQLPVDASGPLGPLILKSFTGNPQIGWKVAWSDRMVSMYGSPLLAAVAYAIARQIRVVKPLALWGVVLLALPMGIDGITHFLSDFAGVGHGFRDSNMWLAGLTGNLFPPSFYAGDALGSFNSIMRLLTGLLFGFGIGWLVFPYMESAGDEIAELRQPTESGPAPVNETTATT